MDESESTIYQKDDSQSFSPKTNILPNSESEPNPSRRDTYSIDAGSIIFEQNSTPTPKRSILKCSKTTKPNRSRSSSRMVQFARLPKSDSRIKMSRSRSNTVPHFVVTHDEFTGADVSQDSRNVTEFDVEEEYDDDLDGVQPLDISVSSLLNSPILDISSVHKSSKRRSRGNKVMSLINSFENRTNDSPKHSIRASDLLSMNGSMPGDTTINNDSQKNSNVLQNSVSSPRRINLEDVFIAEDSLKNASCNLENKIVVHEIDEISEQHTKITSDSEINILDHTEDNTDVICSSGGVSDLSSGVSISENEFNFASPLKIPSTINSSIPKITDLNKSALLNVEKDNLTEVINYQCNTNISQLNISQKNVENSSPLSLTNLSSQNNIDDISNNSSKNINPTSNENDDTIKISNVSGFLEKNNLEDLNKEQQSISELSKISTGTEKDHTGIQNSVADSTENLINVEKDDSNAPSDVSKLVGKPTDVKNDDLSASKLIDEESPSMIIQCISKMLNSSVDELETTHSQWKENLDESYVLVDESDVQNTRSEKTVALSENLNKSLMDSIEVQLDKMHDSYVISNENELVSTDSSPDTNIEKTLTSSVVSEKIEGENPNFEVNDNSSKTSTQNIINSASKTELSVKNNASKNNSIIECIDISELTDDESDKDLNTNNSNSCSKLNSFIDESIGLCETVPSDNCFNTEKDKNKLLNDSQPKTSNISNHTRNSRNLNKSTKDLSANVIRSKKTRSQKIVDEVSSHDKIDQIEDGKEIDNEGTLDTSIGKPQYESTPWNWSKSSKTLNSTASNQANETSHDNLSIIADKQNKTTQSHSSKSQHFDESTHDNTTEKVVEQRNMSRSMTPEIKPEVWSQMMKDFNESVKKASGTNHINVVNKSVKIPIRHCQEFKSNKISIKVTSEDGVSSNYPDSENITQEAENKSNLQCSSSDNCSKTSIEHDLGRSTRNSTRSKSQLEIPKRSLRAKNSQSKRSKLKINKNSEEIINSVLLTDKSNSINTETTIIAKKRSGTTDSNNLNTDVSNENSQGTEKILPPLIKAVTNCAQKNKKTASAKPHIADSAIESEHDSNADTSSNKSIRVTRNKKMTKKKHTSPVLPPTRRNLRAKVENNESDYSNKKHNTVNGTVTDSTSSGNDTVTFAKPNVAVSTHESDHYSNVDTSSNISLRATRNKKMTKKKQSSPELPPTRRNLRAKIEKNDSRHSNKQRNTVDATVTDGTSSENDTELGTSGSANMLPVAKRQLRKKDENLCTEQLKPTLKDKKKLASNKPLKNTSNSDILLAEKSKEIQSIKTRLTRNNSTLNEASLPKLNKKRKSSSPIKTKSVKVGKMKKTIGSKLNKNSHPKNLPSKPITKKNESISSEYESLSETEEIPEKTQLVHNQTKTRKANMEKKDVENNKKSPSLPTRRNRKEITETLNISTQLSTRSRKRPADASPISQPNVKGVKRDISSNIANSTKSRVSNSPKEGASSGTIKLTRNMSKLVASQSSDNSLPETAKIKNKQNITTKSIPKKRVLNSDESSLDCAPSARKMTRKAATKEIEIKKSNSSTRSKSKVQLTDTDDSENSTK